jgi:Xaa-Pro aminopeptidase
MMSPRIKKLRSQLEQLQLDAFLVTLMPHVRYLSGFSGSSGFGLITNRSCYLVTDGRYAQQVKNQTKNWKIFITKDTLFEEAERRHIFRSGWRVGFDGNALKFTEYSQLKKKFPKTKFLPRIDCIEQLAAIKDEEEIGKIKKAVAITDKVFTEILDIIKPGISELDVAAEISYRQRKHGSEADAFESIVVSGVRSSLPHGRPSVKKMRSGELVTLDFGCAVEGYHSDLTRTIVLGKPKTEAKKIYNVVLQAQLRAIDAARNGVKTKDVDAVARDYITQRGYGKYFRHSLGHGIGLQVHEQPRLSVQSKALLQKGNVVTIEPGIYIPNFGGVRIEDDVVITNGQCEVLNKSPKELITL